MEILTVKDLNFTYPDCEKKSVDDISFSVESGDFITLCGPTGSGKSTLLRLLKNELSPLGKKSGEVLFKGKNTEEMSIAESARIGFVHQSPELQTVTDRVWHEIAFGLENLRLPTEAIRRRTAEIMSWFGIEDLFDRSTAELSGGQKQTVALAAVMAMQPDILILDEPTSQLDPVAASDFILTLQKINDELGITVILAEHRLENAVPACNKLAVMNGGKLIGFGDPRTVCSALCEDEKLFAMMPAAARIYALTGKKGVCPLSVKEGKNYAETLYNGEKTKISEEKTASSSSPALLLKDVRFRYRKELDDVLNDASLTVYENEFLCLLGGNGSGKTTLLSVCAGLKKAYAGKIEIFGKKLKSYTGQSLYQNCVALLPQDVQTVFLKNTLEEELKDAGTDFSVLPFDLSYAAKTHPYDLSGGEQQLAALAKALAAKPRLLLLDEPTKGLDANAKKTVGNVLKELQKDGLTVVAVTHDVDFAAMFADRCAMFFRGAVTSLDSPERFFAENSFYTTAVNKIMRGINKELITDVQAAEALKSEI